LISISGVGSRNFSSNTNQSPPMRSCEADVHLH
jgi:hypothetical protein